MSKRENPRLANRDDVLAMLEVLGITARPDALDVASAVLLLNTRLGFSHTITDSELKQAVTGYARCEAREGAIRLDHVKAEAWKLAASILRSSELEGNASGAHDAAFYRRLIELIEGIVLDMYAPTCHNSP